MPDHCRSPKRTFPAASALRRLCLAMAARAGSLLLFSALLPALFCPRAGAAQAETPGWQPVIAEHPATPAYLIAVDKSRQQLSFFERRSPLRLSRMFVCSTGKAVGDKEIEGDLKTPEGIYFVVQRIGSGLDFVKYGPEAYTLNYPNPVDRLRRKTGSGIWIHGRGEPLTPLQTEGCVSLNNGDLTLISKTLVPGTPVALTGSFVFSPQKSGEDAEDIRTIQRKVEEWSEAWSSRSVGYFDFYDAQAYSLSTESFSAFRSQKERLFKSLPWIRSKVRDIQVLQGPGYWVSWFYQDYQAANLSTRGVRRLYWSKNARGDLKIIGMEWQPGLNTSTLLASADPLLPPLEASDPPPSWDQPIVARAASGAGATAAPPAESPPPAPAATVIPPVESPVSPAKASPAESAPPRTAKAAPDHVENPDHGPMARPSPKAFALAEASGRKKESSPQAGPKTRRETSPRPQADVPAHPALSLPPALPAQGLGPDAGQPVTAELPAMTQKPGPPAPAAVLPAEKAPEARDLAAPGPEAGLRDKPEAAGPEQVTLAAAPASPAPSERDATSTPEAAPPAPELSTPAEKQSPAASIADVADALSAEVEAWRKAWEAGDLDAYMAFYAPRAVQGSRSGVSSIRRHKEKLWSRNRPATVRLEDLRVRLPEGDSGTQAAVDMHQEYSDEKGGGDRGLKTLTFTHINGAWRITREDWSPLPHEAGH